MISLWLKMWTLLSIRDQRKFWYLVVLFSFTAFCDALGIFSVMPFMALAMNPDWAMNNEYLNLIFNWMGFDTEKAFLTFVGLGSLCLLGLSITLRIISSYMQLKFSFLKAHELSTCLFQKYLTQDYTFFWDKRSSDIQKTCLVEVSTVVTSVLLPTLALFANAVGVIALIMVVLLVDPLLTTILGGVFTAFYLLVYYSTRESLDRKSRLRFEANASRYEVINEALRNIKQLKFSGTEDLFLNEFSIYSRSVAINTTTAAAIGQLPKYVLELLAFGTMIALVLGGILFDIGGPDFIPLIALYGAVGYRLLPALQGVYHNVTSIKFGAAALDSLITEFDGSERGRADPVKVEPMQFKGSIELQNVCISYDPERTLIEGVSILIPKGSSLCVLGGSGSGKSSILDAIVGLTIPTSGSISVDKRKLETREEFNEFRKIVGYVNQDTHLLNASIAENVNFGFDAVPDLKRVEFILSALDLNSLVNGRGLENSVLGEDAVKISGGQKQRLGIARALYRQPQILILDEGTSALDHISEALVFDLIKNIEPKLTLLCVTHSTRNLAMFDNVGFIDSCGKFVSGSAEELRNESAEFLRLIERY